MHIVSAITLLLTVVTCTLILNLRRLKLFRPPYSDISYNALIPQEATNAATS